MFPLKSLTRWWELGLNFADGSLDAYLPTNRRGTRKGKTLQHQAYLSCAADFLAFPWCFIGEQRVTPENRWGVNLKQMDTFHKTQL